MVYYLNFSSESCTSSSFVAMSFAVFGLSSQYLKDHKPLAPYSLPTYPLSFSLGSSIWSIEFGILWVEEAVGRCSFWSVISWLCLAFPLGPAISTQSYVPCFHVKSLSYGLSCYLLSKDSKTCSWIGNLKCWQPLFWYKDYHYVSFPSFYLYPSKHSSNMASTLQDYCYTCETFCSMLYFGLQSTFLVL